MITWDSFEANEAHDPGLQLCARDNKRTTHPGSTPSQGRHQLSGSKDQFPKRRGRLLNLPHHTTWRCRQSSVQSARRITSLCDFLGGMAGTATRPALTRSPASCRSPMQSFLSSPSSSSPHSSSSSACGGVAVSWERAVWCGRASATSRPADTSSTSSGQASGLPGGGGLPGRPCARRRG